MSLFNKAAELESRNCPFAMVTITGSRGSAPRNSGRMIIRPDGTIFGTVGGGPAENLVIQESLKCLKDGVSRSVSYQLDNGTSKESIDMVCGGNMEFFIEVFLPRPSLFLTGGGHVNLALAELAEKLDFPYVVADTRPDVATESRFPGALGHICETDEKGLINEGVRRGFISSETSLIIATHNHDRTALEAALKTESTYIGMLGSKRKVHLFLKEMKAAGYTDKDLSRVYSPVGLDIGAETPHEIAVSILGEVMKIRSGRSGRSLSLKKQIQKPLVIVRGAGDLASGVICRLSNSGFRIAALEAEQPTVIRRTVAFAEALIRGEAVVEGIRAVRAENEEEIREAWQSNRIPVIADPKGSWIGILKPLCVVDAILAKKNLGTEKQMAPVVIGLGPGFTAGVDVHAVIETNRGHSLGRVILEGPAMENTGIPGTIGGYTSERVIRAPGAGRIEVLKDIESLVGKGELLARIGENEVRSPLDGVVRGMIANGTEVPEGMKIGDVDPRGEISYCHHVSDKARAVAGGVLEAILMLSPGILESGSL